MIERENRTVVELARISLHASKSPIKLWAEAVNYTIHTLNRTGTRNISPIQLWSKRKVNIHDLKTFGEEVYVHIPKEKRQKWDVKAEKGTFVGYDENTKGHRIWFPEKGKVSIHRDVIFTGKQLHDQKEQAKTKTDVHIDAANEGKNSETSLHEQKQPDKSDSSSSDSEFADANETLEEKRNKQTKEAKLDHGYHLRNCSQLKTPERYSGINLFSLIADHEPVSYEEATTCNDAKNWTKAMDEEIDSLRKNETWTLVEPPKSHPIIDNRWTYRIKLNSDGEIQRFKARLVAREFRQQAGIDYHETFSPVA